MHHYDVHAAKRLSGIILYPYEQVLIIVRFTAEEVMIAKKQILVPTLDLPDKFIPFLEGNVVSDIAENIQAVVFVHHMIDIRNQSLVHLCQIRKWSVLHLDDRVVAKVQVRCKVNHFFKYPPIGRLGLLRLCFSYHCYTAAGKVLFPLSFLCCSVYISNGGKVLSG